jgi:hypothetical protein
MEVSKQLEISRVEELRILQNVRLIHKHDLNPIRSSENLRAQLEITGEITGAMTCYLCLDGKELTASERNYIFPLFVEAMNILIGRQISLDQEISHYRIQLSPPKLNMNSVLVDTSRKLLTHKYVLELDDTSFSVLIEYNLSALN